MGVAIIWRGLICNQHSPLMWFMSLSSFNEVYPSTSLLYYSKQAHDLSNNEATFNSVQHVSLCLFWPYCTHNQDQHGNLNQEEVWGGIYETNNARGSLIDYLEKVVVTCLCVPGFLSKLNICPPWSVGSCTSYWHWIYLHRRPSLTDLPLVWNVIPCSWGPTTLPILWLFQVSFLPWSQLWILPWAHSKVRRGHWWWTGIRITIWSKKWTVTINRYFVFTMGLFGPGQDRLNRLAYVQPVLMFVTIFTFLLKFF